MTVRPPQILEIGAGSPSRRLAIDDLAIGDTVVERVRLNDACVDSFAEVSGDRAPLHTDGDFARMHGFDGRVVHGLLIGARFSRLLGMFLPGTDSVIHSFSQRFLQPTPVGATVEVRATVQAVHASVGMVTIKLVCDLGGTTVCQGEAKCVMR